MRDLPADDSWIADRRRAVGAAIRAERLRQKLTQDDIWIASGLSRGTVQRVEAGEDATLSTLLRIAHALAVPLRDLV
ncbi:XRE family transcriptional regulator [Streptomyces sp. WAC 01529]|uniref:helix-turn-helix domain-containing protein n=1 Tax=Streptomyces sp. WAC 01529 TaxID=2203205 RepID=UPI000F6F106F|nr:helix-turn-helix transcriptional regulator [Streptomyces sp. WAC 01529]AZM54182.1 XRE family transcriptional regulator [Streptomyces sp. WAC 01529]